MTKSLFALAATLLASLLIAAAATGQTTDSDGDGVLDNADNCQLAINPSQLDTNGDGFGNFCDPDLDGNNIVNVIDLGIFKAAFFSNPATPHWNPDADFNGDNVVNAIDLGRMKLYFFQPPGPVAFARWNVDTDGNWSDPANWFPVAVPHGDVYVYIDRPVPVTVTYDSAAGNTSVVAIEADDALVLAGGVLTITDTIQVNDTFTLAGGRLQQARVLVGSGGQGLQTLSPSVSSLEDVTLEADLTISDGTTVHIHGDLTLVDSQVVLASDGSNTYLIFSGYEPQLLGGTGDLLFAGTTSFDYTNWVYDVSSDHPTTIGPGIETRPDTAGGLLGWNATPMILQGPVTSALNGRRLTIAGAPVSIEHDIVATGGGELEMNGQWTLPASRSISVTDGAFETTAGSTWSNAGSITLVNSPATLGGTFATADLSNLTSDATVTLAGTLDVSAQALDTDTAPAGLIVSAGTVAGGTVQGSLPLRLTNHGYLDGVTLATDFIVGDQSYAYILNGLTLASADVVLDSQGSYCYVAFNGTQTVSGSGELLFGGTTGSDISNQIYANSGNVLTIEAGVGVRASTSGGIVGWHASGLTLQGTVTSNLPGRTVTLTGNPLIVDGTVTGSGGGNVHLEGTWSNESGNTIAMTDGELVLGGNWTNDGTITVTNGTFVGGEFSSNVWSNNGTIDLTNTTGTLGGQFGTADLFSVGTDGTLLVVGEIVNTGQTLDLDALTAMGIDFGYGGGITGGTLTGTGTQSIGPDNSFFTLDGVTLAVDLAIENNTVVYVENGLTLDNVDLTLASTGNSSQLVFTAGGSLLGSGELRFGGTTTADHNNSVWPSGGALTIGADVTTRTQTSGGALGHASYGLTIEGAVISDIADRGIRIEGNPVTIEGSLTIGASASATSYSGSFEFAASGALDIDLGPSGTGRLTTTSNVGFAGTFNLALVGGLAPTACEEFALVDYADFSGGFDSVNGPDFGGSTFDVHHFAKHVSVQTPGTGCTVNLSQLPGVIVTESSHYPGWPSVNAIDGVDTTSSTWCTANHDPAPLIGLEFNEAIQIDRIEVQTSYSPTYDFLTGDFVARNAADAIVYDSGTVSFTNGEIDLDVIPDTGGVKSLTFSGVTWTSIEPCLSELRVIGPMP